jgi:hypothetical protein
VPSMTPFIFMSMILIQTITKENVVRYIFGMYLIIMYLQGLNNISSFHKGMKVRFNGIEIGSRSQRLAQVLTNPASRK